MIALEGLFNSGLFAYLILLLMVFELLVIWIYHAVTKKGILPQHAVANLGAGAPVMLALGFTIDGVAAHWIVLLLLVALVAHCIDLGHRWNTDLMRSSF